MMDINISFANFFAGCCVLFRKQKLYVSIERVRKTIEKMPRDLKVIYILQKILNNTYDILFLNSIDGLDQKNLYTLGEYDSTIPAFIQGCLIPIFIENELSYSLVLCNYRRVIKRYDKELVKLLTEILGERT